MHALRDDTRWQIKSHPRQPLLEGFLSGTDIDWASNSHIVHFADGSSVRLDLPNFNYFGIVTPNSGTEDLTITVLTAPAKHHSDENTEADPSRVRFFPRPAPPLPLDHLSPEPLHLFPLRARLQQHQVHAHRPELLHPLLHLRRRPHKPAPQPAVRDRVILLRDLRP